jgi:hypothetical protein
MVYRKKSKQEKLREFLMSFEGDIVILDGYEEALIGISNLPNIGYVAVYSSSDIIKNLIENDLMDLDTAEDYFLYNILGSYIGDKSPIFVDTVPKHYWQD